MTNLSTSFENKVALITGAAMGMGLETAKAFAEAGAAVVLADFNEQALRDAAAELTTGSPSPRAAIRASTDFGSFMRPNARAAQRVGSFLAIRSRNAAPTTTRPRAPSRTSLLAEGVPRIDGDRTLGEYPFSRATLLVLRRQRASDCQSEPARSMNIATSACR